MWPKRACRPWSLITIAESPRLRLESRLLITAQISNMIGRYSDNVLRCRRRCPTTNGQAIARHSGDVEAIAKRSGKTDYNEAKGWATTVDLLPMRDADGRQLHVHARRPDITLANDRRSLTGLTSVSSSTLQYATNRSIRSILFFFGMPFTF